MTQRSRFFDSVAGDRVYNADAMAEVLYALMGDGVVANRGNELVVTEDSPAAMSVRVDIGSAFVQGRMFEVFGAQEELTITAADATNPRIDRVVIRLDLSARTMLLAVKAGTPATSPSPPALTQVAGGTWEFSLAQVRVNAAATSITNANITDERGTRAQGPDIAGILNTATGHDHDGTDSKAVAHSATTGRTANDHHNQSHGHTGGDGSGTIAHSATTGRSENDHHNKGHNHTSAAEGGTIAHSSTTGRTANDHHAENHASRHAAGGADPVTPEEIDAWRLGGGGTGSGKLWATTFDPAAQGAAEGDIWIQG